MLNNSKRKCQQAKSIRAKDITDHNLHNYTYYNYVNYGCIIEMQGCFYIRKSLNVIHQTDRFLKINKKTISTLTEKKCI